MCVCSWLCAYICVSIVRQSDCLTQWQRYERLIYAISHSSTLYTSIYTHVPCSSYHQLCSPLKYTGTYVKGHCACWTRSSSFKPSMISNRRNCVLWKPEAGAKIALVRENLKNKNSVMYRDCCFPLLLQVKWQPPTLLGKQPPQLKDRTYMLCSRPNKQGFMVHHILINASGLLAWIPRNPMVSRSPKLLSGLSWSVQIGWRCSRVRNHILAGIKFWPLICDSQVHTSFKLGIHGEQASIG